MDWDKFFDPKNISLDKPNIPNQNGTTPCETAIRL